MRCRSLFLGLGFLALCLSVVIPAQAQPPIRKGSDLLETSTTGGTEVDFSSDPIPAGFFCAGSPAFSGVIKLQGLPLATVPPGIAGNADTILERLNDGIFVGGSASINVIVRALRMTGVDELVITCEDGTTTRWRVDVCLCGDQPVTKIVARVDQACGCGHFDGQLSLNVCLTFTNLDTGEVLGPLSRPIKLKVSGTPWCPNPGASSTTVSTTFAVDNTCDGCADILVPPTSNFHPGWDCATQAGDCWAQYGHLTHCHSSFGSAPHPHCVNPVCGKRQ